MLTLNDSGAVLVAKSLNISIFQQVWLIEHGVINKDEFSENTFFSPMAVNVPTPTFDFLVVPDRIQVTMKSNFDNAGELFTRTIGKIVATLPHTPLTALGLNFNYILSLEDHQKFESACRKIILCDTNPLSAEFDSEDSRFGVYASKDCFDGRLKLDIKPIKKESQESLLLNFNFHHETPKPDNVTNALGGWPDKYNYAQKISNMIDHAMEGT